MIDKWPVVIPELTGKRWKRNVYVYIPDDAMDGERFPVLYMFDGHNVFFDEDATYGKSWGLKEYLESSGTRIMAVAVECSHRPDNDRLKEYSPYSFRDSSFGTIRGRGSVTLTWMTDTLKPRIDASYPTIPDRTHTFLAGSSMGGLMSLYGLLARPDVFSAAAALSPSLWTAPKKLQQLAREAEILPDTTLYMDIGEEEIGGDRQRLHVMSAISATLMERGVNVASRIIPGGTHCEASWEKQLPFLIPMLIYQMEHTESKQQEEE